MRTRSPSASPTPTSPSTRRLHRVRCMLAACPNASVSPFTAAKISHLGLLPQGQPERYRRGAQQGGAGWTSRASAAARCRRVHGGLSQGDQHRLHQADERGLHLGRRYGEAGEGFLGEWLNPGGRGQGTGCVRGKGREAQLIHEERAARRFTKGARRNGGPFFAPLRALRSRGVGCLRSARLTARQS